MDKRPQRKPTVLLCAVADALLFLILWLWFGDSASAFTVWLLVSFAAGLLGLIAVQWTERRSPRVMATVPPPADCS
ncbi:hypothetical protein ASC95_03285 [Pelomonas sp. Root1217]|uniref:hypothetical protein n=1 Tax=Pelomonas sp. Root1217 TaxID=1736430 RepID=UPI000710B7B8|nr:hypothetical protein [Pelomonas sp. Root1217]KQV60488.1 hypothetical protein ASC95_03285 [Pelomonas sp. Root1217]